jgi:hypothetical protein
MFAWNVEPWALNVPVPQAGAAIEAAGAADDAAADDGAADVAATAADADAEVAAAGVDDAAVALVELLLVPHAAAASSPPAVSRVAAMREVLKGKLLLCRSTDPQRPAMPTLGRAGGRNRAPT